MLVWNGVVMNNYFDKKINGLKVICYKDNTNPLINMQLYVRIGSGWEAENEAGYSHLTEHLVFKSTQNFPQNSIMERVTYLGGSINAFTDFDSTCFYLTLPAKLFKEGLEILSELVIRANFADQQFKFEKQVVIEELKQYQDEPEDYFVEEIAKNYFHNNPYRNPIIGNLANLQAATPAKLRKFYKQYYTATNSFLVITGNFVQNELFTSIKNQFGDWKEGKIIPKKQFPIEENRGFGVTKFTKKIENDMLAFVLPDISEGNPKSFALTMATKVFALGKNSRLYERLFTKEKLVDIIRVHSLSGINDGAMVIMIMPKSRADRNEIGKIFIEELQKLHNFGVDQIEIEEVKKELLHHYRYSFEFMENLASSLGNEEVLSDYKRYFEFPKILRKLEKKQIDAIIKKFFSSKHLQIYSLGDSNLEQKKLQNFVKAKKITNPRLKISRDVENFRLANGMRIFLKKVPVKPSVGISLTTKVSQLNETEENRGINLLTAGSLLYGNEKRNYQQLMKYCSNNGIHLGITPSMEATSLKMKCFREMLPMSLELLKDVIFTPTFPKDHIENLRQTYSSNLKRINDYPAYLNNKLWKQMLFGKKSNLLSREGSRTSLGKISRSRINRWYNRYYQPGNMVLTIVGDIEFNEITDICSRLFSEINGKTEKYEQIPLIETSHKHFSKTRKNISQSIIQIGGWGCSTKQPEQNTAFYVLSEILGGDTDSLLFNHLREEQGLAYTVDFSFSSYQQFGYWAAVAIVDKKNEKLALRSIKNVLEKTKSNGISDYELQKMKNYIRGLRLQEEESLLNQAITISNLIANGWEYEYYLQRDKRLQNVSKDIIHNLAEEYFHSQNYFTHILT